MRRDTQQHIKVCVYVLGSPWLGARCPPKLLSSSTGQKRRNKTKYSWVEIRTERNNSLITVMVKPASTWEISLIYYQSRIIINTTHKTPSLHSFLLHRLNITANFHCPLTPWCRGTQLGTAVHHTYLLLLSVQEKDSSHFCTAPAWDLSHAGRQSSMNFSSVSPSTGLQFYRNCFRYLSMGRSSSGTDCSIMSLLQGHRSCHQQALSSTNVPCDQSYLWSRTCSRVELQLSTGWSWISDSLWISKFCRGTAALPWSSPLAARESSLWCLEHFSLLFHWSWSFLICSFDMFSLISGCYCCWTLPS